MMELRPSVISSDHWGKFDRGSQWHNTRKAILERDDNTCQFCGHRAFKYMHVHHVGQEDLATCCVACHAVLHIGRNLSLGAIEIYEADAAQVEIVVETRRLFTREKWPLRKINKTRFHLRKGKFGPGDTLWANKLLLETKGKFSASLDPPLVAVFKDFRRWQVRGFDLEV